MKMETAGNASSFKNREKFIAAVVQAAPVVFNSDATISKVHSLAITASQKGAKLIVFPEAFISAYPKGLDFGATVGSRTSKGRDEFKRYFESSIEVPGPAVDRLSSIAREVEAYIVIGVIERDGYTLYCTVLFFGADGKLLGKHRKLVPTAMERIIWGRGDGSTIPVFDTPLGRLGAGICWENKMPLLRTAMYSKGVQLYCAVTVDDRSTWSSIMTNVALEGGCFVLSSCQYVTRGDCPNDYAAYQEEGDEMEIIRGGSCIISPSGDMLAGPSYGKECILTVEINLGDIVRAKYDFDVVGHYSRPDVFHLQVNERAAFVSSAPKVGETETATSGFPKNPAAAQKSFNVSE